MSDILSDYLSRDDLARQLNRTIRTLERWESLRIGPPITRIGKTPMYHVESVREWLRNQEQKTRRRSA